MTTGFVLAVVAFALVPFGLEARTVASSLLRAQDEATRVKDQLAAGDADGARASLARLQSNSAEAHRLSRGGMWDATAKIPWLGRNVEAVQITSASIDDIAARGLPPVVEAGSALSADSFKPRDGKIDVKALAALAPAVASASGVLEQNADRIGAIEAEGLVGPLVRPVLDLQRQIDEADRAADAASRVMALAPASLGADGEQNYLLVFQTNAEIRSTGGMGGVFVLLSTEDGKLTLSAQSSSDELNFGTDGSRLADAELSDDEEQAFGTIMGRDVRSSNISPDYPRVAQIWADRAEAAYGVDVDVDGVISLDAVAMSYVLRGVGSVDVGKGAKLTADNAIDRLLNGVYLEYEDSADQNDYFEAATGRTFEAVMNGRGDWTQVVSSLSSAVKERRLQVWFRDKDRQKVIASTAVAGRVAQPDETPHVGLYITDSAQSKMQYYLRYDTRVKATTCSADRRQTISVTTSFRNQFSGNPKKAPWYIVGRGNRTEKGNQLLTYRLLTPKGGKVTGFTIDGAEQYLASSKVTYKDRAVQYGTLTVPPGDEISVTWQVQTAPGAVADARYFETPGIDTSSNDVRVPSACR
ncbi:DUF4012 domain-containing protein [Aeromicrobium senzhongii]|uniref:DUF4012 domain-containing protein n=1 Tax=Aeromicrobium senzhongii TaxID=2663859 RepID=A0ABX6SSC6_9ACTN|nr:DUF4012 domain-containing protein [Aeromicrobium senzhongii]MTB89575.1 DUF4012 domain-containing protein [Aeromicrobium senzhongii]QNL94298.1 DUF4012 domain-containing protein [Aeromicrobium senzhongii]